MTEQDQPEDPSKDSFTPPLQEDIQQEAESRTQAIRLVRELTAQKQALQEQLRTPHMDERDEMRLNTRLRRITAQLEAALAEEERTRPRPPEGRIDP